MCLALGAHLTKILKSRAESKTALKFHYVDAWLIFKAEDFICFSYSHTVPYLQLFDLVCSEKDSERTDNKNSPFDCPFTEQQMKRKRWNSNLAQRKHAGSSKHGNPFLQMPLPLSKAQVDKYRSGAGSGPSIPSLLDHGTGGDGGNVLPDSQDDRDIVDLRR